MAERESEREKKKIADTWMISNQEKPELLVRRCQTAKRNWPSVFLRSATQERLSGHSEMMFLRYKREPETTLTPFCLLALTN